MYSVLYSKVSCAEPRLELGIDKYSCSRYLLVLLALSFSLYSFNVAAAPGDLIYSEDFNGNLNDWVIDNSAGGDALIENATADQGRSLTLRWDPVSVTSANDIDLLVPGAELSIWVRRGDDSFSEDPDGNEDLVIEYLNDAGAYIALETFAGDGGSTGEIYNRVYPLDADALHSGMRVRFRQTGGNGSDWDYWHVDSLAITEATGPTVCVSDGSVISGLFATYYDQNRTQRAYFTGNTETRFDTTVNFNWGRGSPITGFPVDDFSVIWEGQVEAGETGAFTFSTVSDDGIRLYVDGNLVINNFTDHGPRRDTSSSINLQAGTRYDIRMEFYERGGGAVAQLEWDGPSFTRQIIPAANLSHECRPPVPPPCEGGEGETSGLTGTYYDQNAVARNYFTGNTETRIDTTVNFNWGSGEPIVGFGRDDFSVVWEGEVESRDAGGYRFSTVSDDGIRLYIDGNLVIDNFTDHGPRRDTSAVVNLFANTRYDVRMEFYERGGGAVAQLEWTGPSFIREVIPSSQLYAQCPALMPIANYAMEESAWTGAAAEVLDASANGFNGSSLGAATVNPLASSTAALMGDPGTCGYGEFPFNNSAAVIDAIDTGLDVDTDIGSTGTIAFWYRSNNNWVGGGERQLFDAAKRQGLKYFFLTLRNDGRLRFGLEDSSDGDFRYSSPAQNIAADEWSHIAVSWDLPNDEFLMYREGALITSYTPNTNGVIGDMANLFIGDNNGDYIINNDTTANSANGAIDEFKVFNFVLSAAQVTQAMNEVRPCAPLGPDHIEVVITGNASTCVAKDVVVRACADAACGSLFANYAGTVQLDTSTANGDWSYNSGPGNFIAGAADSGNATFEFVTANAGTATLQLSNSRAESLTITGVDTVDVTLRDTTQVFSFSDNAFVITDIDSLTEGVSGADVAVAGRDHRYRVDLVRRDNTQSPADCSVASEYNNSAQALKVWIDRSQLASAAAPQINNISLPNSLPASTNISLDFSAGGTASFDLQTSDVGQFNLEFTDDSRVFANNIDIVGSSNRLLVRPFAFDIDFVIGGVDDRETNGTASISYAQNNDAALSPNPNASVFAVAGADITARITATRWEAADDLNNDGLPDTNANLHNNLPTVSFGQESPAESVTLLNSLAAPLGGSVGVLSGSNVAGFSGGTVQQVISWSEVGIINLDATLADNDYLASGIDVGGVANNVGRFIPANFIIKNNMAISDPEVSDACVAPNPFTYMGQEFTVNYELLAVNTSGAVTENYTADFVKLNNSLGSVDVGAVDSSSNTDLTARLPLAGQINTNTNYLWGPDMGATLGVGEIETLLTIDRAALPDGAHTVSIGVLPVDEDGVTVLPAALDLDVDADLSNDHANLGESVQRYGRVFLENVFGPEERALEMPFIAQYFDASVGTGGRFVSNRDDNCTAYLQGDFSLVPATYTQQLDPGDTSISAVSDTNYINASGSVTLSSPGNDNFGSVDVIFTVPNYLQYDWDADNTTPDTSPRNTATFGSYRGNDRIIYRREVGR